MFLSGALPSAFHGSLNLKQCVTQPPSPWLQGRQQWRRPRGSRGPAEFSEATRIILPGGSPYSPRTLSHTRDLPTARRIPFTYTYWAEAFAQRTLLTRHNLIKKKLKRDIVRAQKQASLLSFVAVDCNPWQHVTVHANRRYSFSWE